MKSVRDNSVEPRMILDHVKGCVFELRVPDGKQIDANFKELAGEIEKLKRQMNNDFVDNQKRFNERDARLAALEECLRGLVGGGEPTLAERIFQLEAAKPGDDFEPNDDFSDEDPIQPTWVNGLHMDSYWRGCAEGREKNIRHILCLCRGMLGEKPGAEDAAIRASERQRAAGIVADEGDVFAPTRQQLIQRILDGTEANYHRTADAPDPGPTVTTTASVTISPEDIEANKPLYTQADLDAAVKAAIEKERGKIYDQWQRHLSDEVRSAEKRAVRAANERAVAWMRYYWPHAPWSTNAVHGLCVKHILDNDEVPG